MTGTAFSVTLLICVSLTVIAILYSRRVTASIRKMEESLSEEKKNEIMNQTFQKAEGKDLFVSQVYVLSVKEKTAVLFYYSGANYKFQYEKIRLPGSSTGSGELREDTFVPALMKYNGELGFYSFKKLL